MNIRIIVKKTLRNLTLPVLLLIHRNLKVAYQRIVARKELARHSRLHLGCGPNIIEGWANIDLYGPKNVICWDLTRPLPVSSETIKFIYSEHFVEHISLEQARGLLGECYRVLQPGGVLRVSTPSLRKLIDLYLSGKLLECIDVGWNPSTPCRLMNEGMRLWGHLFVYDCDELKHLLEAIGFCNLTRVIWHESNYE